LSRAWIRGSGFGRDLLVPAVLAMFATAAAAQESVDLERGKQVFDQWCAACHGDGPGKPGTAALNALYKGQKPALLEERTDLVPELTKQFVRTGVSVMPFFRKTEISDADLEALAAYLAP
jgi:mono/diheme cytochrome c family protein